MAYSGVKHLKSDFLFFIQHPSPVCFTPQAGGKRDSGAFNNLGGDLDRVYSERHLVMLLVSVW